MQYLDYMNGHDFGVGIDAVNGSIKGDAVIRTAPEEVSGAEGQKVLFDMMQVETTEELTEALGASAEVNVGMGLFNASAQFNFAQQASVNRYSLYLLVSVSVTNAFRQLRDVRLTQDAVNLWASGNQEEFRDRYGDEYIHGVLSGGILHSVLQIDTESEEESQEISAKLEAGYGALGMGFSAKAQFNKMMSSVSTSKSIKVHHLQIGGSNTNVGITSDQILDRATQFPPSVAGKDAAPFLIMTKEYKTVSNLPAQPNKFDLLLAKDVVKECGRLRLRYLDWLNDIEYILGHPQQFAWTNESKQTKRLDTKADELREAITGLAKQASKCANNLTQCEMPTDNLTVVLDADDVPDRKRRNGRSGATRRRRIRVSPRPVPGMLNSPFRGPNGTIMFHVFAPDRVAGPKLAASKRKNRSMAHQLAILAESRAKVAAR